MNSKTHYKFRLSHDMKNYADLLGCYPPRPYMYTLLDLNYSSYHTQPHPIFANYCTVCKMILLIFLHHKQDNPANLDKVLTKQAEELFNSKR